MKTKLSPRQRFNAIKRAALVGCGVTIALLILFSAASVATAAPGKITIVNLTAETIYVANAEYVPGVNNSGLAYVPWDNMRFNGWYSIEPGKSRDFSSGRVYVKDQNRNRISWSNQKEWSGLVRHGSAFNNVIIESGTYGKFESYYTNLDKFLNTNSAYSKVTYQSLGIGRYQVTATSGGRQVYQILSKTFPFDFRSRDFKMLKDCYPVQGTPVDYALAGEQRKHGPSDTWSKYSDRVCVSVIVKGFQPNPFAAREQGYYVGSVTVYYTVPLR